LAEALSDLASVPVVRWFERRAVEAPGAVAYRYKDRAIWHEVSWARLRGDAAQVSACLVAEGLNAGDRVLWLAATGPRWPAIELAVEAVGAALCAVDPRFRPADELAHIFERLDPHLVIADRLDDVLPLASGVGDAAVHVALIGPAPGDLEDERIRLHSLTRWELQESVPESIIEDWKRLVDARKPDDVIRVALTAGVDGPARLVALTARDIARPWVDFFTARSWGHRPGPADRSIVLQPVERTTEFVQGILVPVLFGATAHLPESLESRDVDMVEVSPTLVIAAARLWEVWMADVLAGVQEAGRVKRAVFSMLSSIRRNRLEASGAARFAFAALTPLWLLGLRHPLLSKLGLADARTALVVGARPHASLIPTFRDWGVALTEAYGTAETADLAATGQPGLGGSPLEVLPAVEADLKETGELVLWAEAGVSTAYVGGAEPSATLVTGDHGSVTGRSLVVAGRLADLRIMDGTAVPVDAVESQLRGSPHIAAAVVMASAAGLMALLEVSYREVNELARRRDASYSTFQALAESELADEVCREVVEGVNQELREKGQPVIRAYRVLPRRLSRSAGEVIASGRVRRRLVAAAFSGLIDEMSAVSNPKELAGARA
jgi:long-chain acyl-CoA synthetase